MNPEDFYKALEIGRFYFDMCGTNKYWTMRALGDCIAREFMEGESRPLVIANRAIARMESELGL